MKKLLILLIIVLGLTSCTKYYLTADMLSYEIEGQSATVDYYSNTAKTTKTAVFNYTTCRYSEIVQPGDSLSLFIIDGSSRRTNVKIYLGTALLYDGQTDNTGLLFINYKFHQSDFRLK